jgi:pimeloyl-ACP methyl ester carboxylesterase
MLTVNGAELRVRVEGEGDALPLVFVHGYGSRLESWRAVQPAFASSRMTVCYDQRGFGLSERAARGYGPKGHAADLLALMDALHVERAVIVAHSYGAGVALQAALVAPERIAGIVLVSPFALDQQLNATLRWAKVPLVGEYLYATSFRGFSGEKYQLAFKEGGRFATLAALDEVEAIQAIPRSDQAALATVRAMDYADLEARYRTITAPVRVVWGEADRVTPIRTLPAFAEHLPQATFVRVPGVGHMPSWEAPAIVVDNIHVVLAAAAGGG